MLPTDILLLVFKTETMNIPFLQRKKRILTDLSQIRIQ